MTNLFIIETEFGIIKKNDGKAMVFETQFEALNYIEDHYLKNAIVIMADEEDL